MLFLGRPGVGKTTMLREVARVLADEMNKRVIIVDTSNEIAGDGDIPHPAIGSARRMQVARPQMQHAVMIEAVENHMPEVIVIDEIGTELEAQAARTIAERGVQLVGTAHGNTLENLMANPTLSDLIGGIQSTAAVGNGVDYVASHELFDGTSLDTVIPRDQAAVWLGGRGDETLDPAWHIPSEFVHGTFATYVVVHVRNAIALPRAPAP